MASIRRAATLLAFLAVLAGCAVLPGCANAPLETVPAFDHYDPAKLRAAAAEREAAGDAATARVLRARADRLEPHAPRTAAIADPVAPPAPPLPLLPEPPALWPSR